jgi:hypothetical protein
MAGSITASNDAKNEEVKKATTRQRRKSRDLGVCARATARDARSPRCARCATLNAAASPRRAAVTPTAQYGHGGLRPHASGSGGWHCSRLPRHTLRNAATWPPRLPLSSLLSTCPGCIFPLCLLLFCACRRARRLRDAHQGQGEAQEDLRRDRHGRQRRARCLRAARGVGEVQARREDHGHPGEGPTPLALDHGSRPRRSARFA